jgi:hypothetical protein
MELRKRGFNCSAADIQLGAREWANRQASSAADLAAAAALYQSSRPPPPAAPMQPPINCVTQTFGGRTYTNCQ